MKEPKFKIGDEVWVAIYIREFFGPKAKIVQIRHNKTWKENYFDEAIVYTIQIQSCSLKYPIRGNIPEERIFKTACEIVFCDPFNLP